MAYTSSDNTCHKQSVPCGAIVYGEYMELNAMEKALLRDAQDLIGKMQRHEISVVKRSFLCDLHHQMDLTAIEWANKLDNDDN